VLALAESDRGEKLFGLASDDLTTFRLEAAPLEPSLPSYDGITNALTWELVASRAPAGLAHGTPYCLPHEPRCVRARVRDDGSVFCIEHAPLAGMGEGPRWLADGFFAMETSIGHVDWGARTLPIASPGASMCYTRGSRIMPPRAVSTCHGSRVATLWAPGRILDFQGPADPNDLGGVIGADVGPVLPIQDEPRAPDAERPPVTRWLDLEGLRVLVGPKLRPLGIASFAGVDTLSLAEEQVGRTSRVWVVDFSKGTRELAASITDCPGELGELRENHAAPRRPVLVLACMSPAPKHTVAHALLWTELVDTEKRRRFRTPLLPEILYPDGLVVLSTRRALAAESRAAPGELFSVDLAAP
jgi:hypothetical protein